MLGSQAPLLDAIVGKINSSIAAEANIAGVKITQVNILMPDGRPVTLEWNDEANDWLITAT